MAVIRPLAKILLLAEAAAWLVAAKLALRLVHVRRIISWKQQPVRSGPALSETDRRNRIRQVTWAVEAVARRSPVAFVCFPQSLAAHALLARRGIATRLHYGVLRIDDKLEAHAWLEAHGTIVTGADEAPNFALLETY